MQQDKDNSLKRRRMATIISLCVVLIFVGLLTWAVCIKLKEIGSPENFRSFIESFGAWGVVVGLFIQMLQVVVAFIPGEIVEVGLGSAFGALWGTVLCMVGVSIASSFVFLLTKKYGIRMVELFFDSRKIDELRFINSEKRLKYTVFLLFFIPGTPKDLLTYFVGLTRMKLPQFLAISMIARIPSIVSSTVGGNMLSNENYIGAIILFAVTGAVSVLGIVIYNSIVNKKNKKSPQ